ncbi:MAG: glycosyltransferase family 4 protein [Cyanobacteria bacterium]|nr:glycosyltransferase family 4 protein [Cyanobacteriota bacterium]MDW8202968.1 glycosyltransferase family 4 protein [Cyanobacteriota bacterium SKYGB_h_bin112]
MTQRTDIQPAALVFFPHNPYPPKTGAHWRCLTVLTALKTLGYRITLLGTDLFSDHPWPVDDRAALQTLQAALDVQVEVYQGTAFERFLAVRFSALSDRRYWDSYTPLGLRQQFRQVFRKLQPSVVVVNYGFWGELAIGQEFRTACRLIDTIDLCTLNRRMRLALQGYIKTLPLDPNQLAPPALDESCYQQLGLEADPIEYHILDQFDYTIAIAPAEADLIRRHTQHTQVAYLPMVATVPPVSNTYSGQPIFAIGGNPFNLQGYAYFALRILPLVRSRLPQFQLQVVGSACREVFPAEGINLTGFVPDLTPVYADSPFAICPLIGGTGQQTKIVEAMAHGVPVIALRNVAASSPIQHGVNGLIADQAEDFADYVVELYNNRARCRQLGAAARQTIAEQFSQATLTHNLQQLLDQFGQSPVSRSLTLSSVQSDASQQITLQITLWWRWIGYWAWSYLPFLAQQHGRQLLKHLLPSSLAQRLKAAIGR